MKVGDAVRGSESALPSRARTPIAEIVNTFFLCGCRSCLGRADVLALCGKRPPNNKYKNNSYYRK